MLKKLFSLIKKIIFAVLFIYAYNVIAFPLNSIVPINIFTIFLVTILGFPALIGICLFSLFVF